MKIAVTGGIGSGKSFVCSKLEQRGFKIYNCDDAAKRIIASSEKVKNELIKAVGEDAFLNGKLNKSVLTAFLLKNDDNAKVINGIVHPAVAEDFIKSGDNWMECAILFSSGFDRLVDKTICVTAPAEVRINRIMQRDNISRQRAEEWINKQMPQEELVTLCDYEIVNDGLADLDVRINQILKSLER